MHLPVSIWHSLRCPLPSTQFLLLFKEFPFLSITLFVPHPWHLLRRCRFLRFLLHWTTTFALASCNLFSFFLLVSQHSTCDSCGVCFHWYPVIYFLHVQQASIAMFTRACAHKLRTGTKAHNLRVIRHWHLSGHPWHGWWPCWWW